jgi:hypothetical protein
MIRLNIAELKKRIFKISDKHPEIQELQDLAKILKLSKIEPRFRGKKVFFYTFKPKYDSTVKSGRLKTDEALGGIPLDIYEKNKKMLNKLVQERKKEELKKFLEQY